MLITHHGSLATLSCEVAHRIGQIIEDRLHHQARVSIALAGGRTPRGCYLELAQLHLPWDRIDLFLGDERCHPIGHPDRNDSLIKESLLAALARPPSFFPIPAELGSEAGATSYSQTIEHCLPLDLALLGLGEDGHTASLFPDNPALAFAAVVVPVHNAPKPPPERISLGLSTLIQAKQRLFMVSGSDKQDALNRLKRGERLPAGLVGVSEWHVA